MNKDDDDTLEDVDSLVKRIGGKKKDVPQRIPVADKALPATGAAESGSGDFSALIKKLSLANKPEPVPDPVQPAAEPPRPSIPPRESLDSIFSDTDEPSGQRSLPPEPPRTTPDLRGRAVGKMSDAGAPPAAAPAPQKPTPPPARAAREAPVPAAEDEVIEIIDEDPKAAVRKRKAAKKVVYENTEEAPRETESEEKIISVDQITDLSGLILPKGATFKIDEINLHGRINAFESTGSSALPAEFAEIWKKEFSAAGFKDLDIDEETITEKAKAKPVAKKFGLGSIFRAIRAEQEEYDPKVHGPLVDLSFVPRARHRRDGYVPGQRALCLCPDHLRSRNP